MRTPLNGILAFAELIASADLPPREREWAAAIKTAADHLANLTTLVVDGARAGLGKLNSRHDVFDLDALARSLAQSLTARAGVKGLAVDIAVGEDLPRAARGDPVLLRAAIENLLDNAVKFTEDGRITLTVTGRKLVRGRFRLVCAVADQGIGMSAAEMRRLFRPFAQANGAVAGQYGGAGLGLAFARQVAQSLGGALTVRSVSGKGSVFRFAAVLESASAEGQGTATCATRAGMKRPLRILCAEDNPYGRVMFKAIAGALGHTVEFVASGEAAVQAAAGGGYDLAVIDLTLSGMDGLEATRRIRALNGAPARLPIIGISGRSAAADSAAARAAGMDAFLVKPVGARALAAELDAALELRLVG